MAIFLYMKPKKDKIILLCLEKKIILIIIIYIRICLLDNNNFHQIIGK